MRCGAVACDAALRGAPRLRVWRSRTTSVPCCSSHCSRRPLCPQAGLAKAVQDVPSRSFSNASDSMQSHAELLQQLALNTAAGADLWRQLRARQRQQQPQHPTPQLPPIVERALRLLFAVLLKHHHVPVAVDADAAPDADAPPGATCFELSLPLLTVYSSACNKWRTFLELYYQQKVEGLRAGGRGWSGRRCRGELGVVQKVLSRVNSPTAVGSPPTGISRPSKRARHTSVAVDL